MQVNAVRQMLTESVVCKTFANQYVQAQILENAQALFVIIINVLLQASMEKLTEFERHHTKSAYMCVSLVSLVSLTVARH